MAHKMLSAHRWAIIFSFVFLTGAAGPAEAIEADEALTVARQIPEAVAFLSLFDGNYKHCIEEEVVKSCESDWVTCLEDGWVVRFSYKESCGVINDGRLQLTIVVDGSGKVISRFPEEMYFKVPRYCLEDYDCLSVLPSGCLNFIYGPFYEVSHTDNLCVCQSGRCGLKAAE